MSAEAIGRAQQRAKALYPRSKGFRGAYVAGATAAIYGRDSSACPYADDPTKTWRRTWRLAWMRGHQSCRTIEDEG